jgi:4-aminobutyrate aminotransferase-like enzyme
MAMTPEGRVKEAVKKVLRHNGVWYYQPVQNGMGRVGIPDFICCWHGMFIAIETKAPGNVKNTTANQDAVIAEIREHGGYCMVVDNATDVMHHLKGISVANILESSNASID